MLRLTFVSALLFGFLSTATASLAPAKRAESSAIVRGSSPSLLKDIVRPTDVIVKPLGRFGEPLSPEETVRLFLLLQLELYRKTVQHDGDGALPRSPPFKRVFKDKLEFMLVSTRGAEVTFGAALLAVQFILHGMLYPLATTNGFKEGSWELYLKTRPKRESELGTITLFKIPGGSRSITSDISSSSVPVNSSQPSSPSLTGSPFPIHGTDVFLDFSKVGRALPAPAVIWNLQLLIAMGWSRVASRHSVSRVEKTVFKDDTGGIEVSVQPRIEAGSKLPLMTDTDMVEAAFGIVSTFLNSPSFGVTTVAVLRSDERGVRIPVGEIVIAEAKAGSLSVGSGNASSVETA